MINRFHVFLFLVILFTTVVSYPLFMYFAQSPQVLLGIERTQPGSLDRIGREMLQAGNLQKAVEAFERAQEKYEALYEETGLERHRQFAAISAISVADSNRILGVTPEWQHAVDIYASVLQDYPRGNHGSWNLSLGMALEQLQRYDKAINQFDIVIKESGGITQLYARYERGRSYLEKGDLDTACDDLYWFVRSQRWEISEEQWLEFLRLEHANNPKRNFILGFTYRALNEPDKAVASITHYLSSQPNDRAALYLRSSLLDEPFVQDSPDIALTELMPPQEQSPYILTGGLLNLYIAEAGDYEFILELSSPPKQELDGDEIVVPEISIICNGENRENFFVSSNQAKKYPITLPLMEGKNILQIETQGVGMDDPLVRVEVHSIRLIQP